MVSYKGIGFSNDMVKKLASEGVKQIAQKSKTSAMIPKGAGTYAVLATLAGLGLRDAINKNNISFPMSRQAKKDEKENKTRLEIINEVRRNQGLPEITMAGEYITNPQSKATTSPNKTSNKTSEYKSSNQPLSRAQKGSDSVGNLIRQIQSANELPSIEQISDNGANQSIGQRANYTLEDLLAMKQAQAQQKQATYQPQLDLLQAIIKNAQDMSEWQGRQNNISAGLAGITGNDLIYKATQDNNPLNRALNIANLYGQQAQLQDQLRYDPYQTLSDVSFAQSEGYNPMMALANNDLVTHVTNAQKLQNQMAMANQKLQQDMAQREQQNAMDMLNYNLNLQRLAETRDYHNKLLEAQAQKANAKATDNITTSLRDLDDIENMVRLYPDAIGLAHGALSGKIVNRLDSVPEHITTRTIIDNFRTNFRHALTGANFTVKEIAEYDRFLPNISDNQNIIIAKIKGLKRKLNADLQAKGLSINNQNQLPNIDKNALEAEMKRRGLRK